METLGKYKIEAKLGQGAMGCVYKAWHPGFHDYVSLKAIQDTRLEGAQLLERFKREGQALAKLKHQNIVQIYDADQADGIHFIVMEYMNGGSLDRIIERRDRSPLAKRVSYIVPACHALSYAHRRGLFHRDIKPANIMLHNDGNDEVVKVVDFGIARLVDLSETQDFSMSQTNILIGSPAYMAPELLTGTDRANERTDIWALGVTLYELISFERPFQGKDFDDLRRSVIYAKAKSLRHLAPECPHDLDAVVQRMIDKDASRRYPTVEDLLIDLEPIAKRLRSETAVSLIHRANDLCEIGEMENAKSVLTEARRYDPANTQLRELLQKIDEELRRRDLLPRLHTHLKRARDFVHREEYQNARQEIASALSLDATFEPARKYREEIEDEVKKKDFVQEKLRLTRLRITEGELTQAEIFLKELEELDSDNTQSLELRREIEQEKQRRGKRKRLNEIVNRAGVLMAALQEDECLVLLSQGLQEYPEEAELLRLQEIVRDDVAEASRQQERQRGIEELRGLVGKDNFEAAQEKAQQLLRKFPDDVVVENLRSFMMEEIGKDKRRARLRAGIDEVRSLLSRRQAGAANAALQNLLKEYPGEPEIHDLQNSVDLKLEKQGRKQTIEEEQQTSIAIIEDVLKRGNLDEAGTLLVDLERTGIQHVRIAGLQTRLQEAKENERRQKQLESECSKLESLLQHGALQEALSAGQELLDKWPDSTRLTHLVKKAKEEIEARGQNGAIDAGIRSIRKKLRSKKYTDAVAAAEKLLSRFPAEAGVRAVHDEVANALQERKKQEIVQNKTREIRQKIHTEQQEEAVGEPTRILQQLGPQEEIEVLLRAADVELRDQRAREKTEERKLSETRVVLANGKKDEALELAQGAATAGDKTAAIHEAPETEMNQQSTHSNERTLEIASDYRRAVQADENDRVTSRDAAPIEYSMEVSVTGAGENQGSHNLQDGAARLGIDFTKSTPSIEVLRTKARLIGFLAGAVAIAGLAFLITWRITEEAAKRETSAFHEATKDEHDKRWPGAVTEYKTLAGGHGALAVQAGKEYTRLAALLEKETDLKQNIEQATTTKSYDQAEILLTELADLHGDMEEVALKEKHEVALKEEHEEPKLVRAPLPDDKRNTKKNASGNPEVPTQTDSGCELSASDLPVRLNRADRNSAQGDYASAEREYLAVLACQPNNEQARIGLERTRKAKIM